MRYVPAACQRHPDEQRPVVAVVGRPPVLRCRHHLEDVALQRLDVEGLELLCVVEVLAHRVGQGRVLVQDLQVQLVRPPVPVAAGPMRLGSRGGDYRVFAFAFGHVGPSFREWVNRDCDHRCDRDVGDVKQPGHRPQ